MSAALQETIARRIVVSGTFAMVLGMVYGTQVHDETFGNSILMLYVHSQLLLCGLHQLVGGILLFLPQICSFESKGALKLIEFGNVHACWILYGFDLWGPLVGVSWPRVLREGGLPPLAKDDIRFTLFSLGHYIPASVFLVSWGVILYGCIYTKSSTSKGVKSINGEKVE
ncbi:hypothetical protein T439DRAFT_330368 [Meredithblackwellia eburnea MCA 4105]